MRNSIQVRVGANEQNTRAFLPPYRESPRCLGDMLMHRQEGAMLYESDERYVFCGHRARVNESSALFADEDQA
jgi:hypothetical protein